MTRTTVRVERHYEVHEAPFARAYKWYPARVTLKSDCGEKFTLTGTSTVPICGCGQRHSDIIQDMQEREERLRYEYTYPWHYDTREQIEQHLQDETVYPKNSPWRYNDVTWSNANDA